MAEWIDELASALDEDPLTGPETNQLLNTARDVAHRVERRITPLTTFLAGVAAGRRMALGASRAEALGEVLTTVTGVLPEEGFAG